MGDEHLGERWFLMDHAENRRFFQSHDDGVRHRRGRRYPVPLSGQTSFTEEIVRTKNCDDGFLASLRNDRDLYLAGLKVEDRIGGISLGEDDLRFRVRMPMLRPSPTLARKDFGLNDGLRLIAMTRPFASQLSEERTL